MSVATLARKPGLALPNTSMRKMFGVMARVGEHRTGLGKQTHLTEETSLGHPNPQPKSIPEPGWSGWMEMHISTTTASEEVGASAEPGGWSRL